MEVRALIEALREMPQDAEVYHLWDGAPRTAIEVVYLARSGAVITADWCQDCYEPRDRPEGAPDSGRDRWSTPSGLEDQTL